MNLIKKQLRIDGMTCVNCQNKIAKALSHTPGVQDVNVSYNKAAAAFTYDSDAISLEQIIAIIEDLDYEVRSDPEGSHMDISRIGCFLIIIICLYILLQKFGILNLLVPSQLADSKMGYGMLFIIGIITSVHCIAMCGGINLSQCIPRKSISAGNDSKLSVFLPALLYNLGRVISYTVIGFLLGLIGMLISGDSEAGVSTLLQGILKLIAGAFMVIMGINMLGIVPWLRKLNLRMPKFLAVKIGKQKVKNRQPFFIGLLNGLMPCGPLQSMQIIALASGNPFVGALSMFLFSLGTVPLMLGLGSIVSALGRKFARAVMNIGAILVVVLGLAMLSQGVSLSGIQLPKQQSASSSEEAEIVDDVQIVHSTLSPGSYPDITVQAGIPVKWIIDAPAGSINGCNHKMILSEYGIEYTFEEGENVIEFTPTEAGAYGYTCWMGMIRGNIYVTDGNNNVSSENVNSDDASSENTDSGDISSDNKVSTDAPVPSGYQIPSDDLAVAKLTTDNNGNTIQEVSIELTDGGFSPAVIVVQSDVQVIWNINVSSTNSISDTALLAPVYSTRLDLEQGENQLYLYPSESFDVSTGDNQFYAYIKVVDDINDIDTTAIQQEVDEYETLIYPESIYESSGTGGSCCG